MIEQIAGKDILLSTPSSSNGQDWTPQPHLFPLEKSSLVSMKRPQEGGYGWDMIKTIVSFFLKPFNIVWKLICSLIAPSTALPQSNNLVDFYLGNTSNTEGVSLMEIWGWDDEQLEDVHTHIQWLFPSKNRSVYNSNAPTLNQKTIQAFHQDPVLRKNLLHSFQRMLAFYGLQWNGANRIITRASNCRARQSVWLTAGNHNFLRITRILACLSHLGLKAQAQAFLAILADVQRKEGKGIISSKTMGFWRSAIH